MGRWLRRKSDEGATLSDLIGDYELPHFRVSTLEALTMLRDESASVAKIVGVDPGLAVRILRLVNSAGFGLRHRVDDVGHAVPRTSFARGTVAP